MCDTILNTETNEEADSVSTLRKMLGPDAKIIWYDDTFAGVRGKRAADLLDRLNDSCLCSVDIEATAKAAGWDCVRSDSGMVTDYLLTPPSGQKTIEFDTYARTVASSIWTAMYPERTAWLDLPKDAQDEWITYAKLANAICRTSS